MQGSSVPGGARRFHAGFAILFALLTLLAVTSDARAAEDRPMSAAEFEAYTEGRTLSFGVGGEVYGMEQYRPGRRVTWTFLDGECSEGRWYAEGAEICFVYDDIPSPQCWLFFRGEEGLVARFSGPEGPSTVLYEVGETREPMMCLGPEVGV
jgi:hypothetical protein